MWIKRLEKPSAAAAATFLVALINLATAVKAAASICAEKGVCRTPECVSQARHFMESMNQSVNPCDNFYQYACGGLIEKWDPGHLGVHGHFYGVVELAQNQTRDILKEASDGKESDILIQAKNQYQACMNLQKLDEQGVEPMKALLKELGGWPVLEGDNWDNCTFSLTELIAKLRKNGFETDNLLYLWTKGDDKNSSRLALLIDEPNDKFVLGSQRLTQGLDNADVKKYFNLMQNVALLFGANPSTVEAELKKALLLEVRVANATVPRYKLNPNNAYNPMTLETLNTFAKVVPDWKDYVNNFLTENVTRVDYDYEVIVTVPQYLQELAEILSSEESRTIANYVVWNAVKRRLQHVSRDARKLDADFETAMSGAKTYQARYITCTKLVTDTFAKVIGKKYVLKHFKDNERKSVKAMLDNVKRSMKNSLGEVSWMDDATKSVALGKLEAMSEIVGYPDEIMSDANLQQLYGGLFMRTDQHLENMAASGRRRLDNDCKRLTENDVRRDWRSSFRSPTTVNAFYLYSDNEIILLAAILQAPFFASKRPKYLNYGGIGWLMGHEIAHAFDGNGRQYDADGNLNDWWLPKTNEGFLVREKCFITQFSKYKYNFDGTDMSLNGNITKNEVMADNWGVQEAYNAYGTSMKGNQQEGRLPGLKLTAKQLLWLNFAYSHCTKYHPKRLQLQFNFPHPPSEFRVNGALSNFDDFARDFNCPAGSPMNPSTKCSILF